MNEDISFARYFRPSNLDDYIGNTKVKETLRRVLKPGNKRPQSILLSGNTGCGKTTIARIISSWYTCEDPNEDGSPCGCCVNCENMKEYIQTGNTEMLADIREIDSSDKGKSDMAQLLEEMEYPAYGGGWKIYIIDEAHALSLASNTLLLKPLEEPPEKVLIIFATTNPEKMLDTVRNRCQLQLKIMKPSTSELTGLLKKVCTSKGKDYDMQGLRMICSRADFVIRNSLNYLEQVLTSRGTATGDDVASEFDEVSDSLLFEFFNAYTKKDYLGYINIMYKIKTTYDFGLFLQSLISFTTRGIYVINNINVEGLSEVEIQSYLKVFSAFSVEELAFILSSLKKMPYGDIETNLMSFIYTTNIQKEETLKVEVVESSSIVEAKFRNSNLKALEMSKVRESHSSLESSLEEVSVEDAMSLFNLEKVKK